MINVPERQIRATHNEQTIRVYQAYGDTIANSALATGTFCPPLFRMNRMTWIKPSFLWMMYRSGWGYKDINQSRILAIDIIHDGFRWAIEHSCPSHPNPRMKPEDWEQLKAASPVRIQWDPERDLNMNPLPYRTIQVGLGAEAARLYTEEWIKRITDVTLLAKEIFSLRNAGREYEARRLLPIETPYLEIDISKTIS